MAAPRLAAIAAINLTANTLSVGGSLDALIDNTVGSIGGNAAINMNVSGTATVTNDATVADLRQRWRGICGDQF